MGRTACFEIRGVGDKGDVGVGYGCGEVENTADS